MKSNSLLIYFKRLTQSSFKIISIKYHIKLGFTIIVHCINKNKVSLALLKLFDIFGNLSGKKIEMQN